MFKDYDKYLSASLKVYIFILIIVFIMKLVGLNYFGLDVNNPILIKISNFLSNTHWGDLYYMTTIYIQGYFMLCLSTKKNKLYKETLIFTLLLYMPQCIMNMYFTMDWLYYIWSFICLLVYPMIISKNLSIKRQVIFILLTSFYQLISMIIRSVGINQNYNNFIVESILNIDQLLMLAITYNLYFMKGGVKSCGEEVEAFYSLLKKNHFSNLQKKLQKNYSQYKKLNKQEKATVIIYSILSIFWNIFTVITVFFIATLNDTIIECIFILISFWISKKIFGKAFHLNSMIQCFVISNITYYFLNKMTTPIGISILIPIMLGTLLAYTTSKLVKEVYKPLYKGMPENEFKNTILKVVKEDSLKYKICYDYYINRENAIFLGRKYSYTEAGIRQIASRINKQIKALN